MSQTTENPMRKISLEKVVLNMGLGRSGDVIQVAKTALEQIQVKPQQQEKLKRPKEIGE
ncbi:MAG: 50S ribosomal protein L5 [Nitrosopumilaceae archaeon]